METTQEPMQELMQEPDGRSGSPLELPGWHEFNRWKWGVTLEEVCIQGDSGRPSMEAMLYLDKRGRICQPLHNPYLPLRFLPTPTRSIHRLTHQWLEVSEALAARMRERKLAGMLMFGPEVSDVRPWQWAGYDVGVRYTISLDFPYDLSAADGMVRNRVKKAGAAGYRCERVLRPEDVQVCLRETEQRQGFVHRVSGEDLRLLTELLGEEQVRSYICYAPNGEPATAQVILHRPGGRALGWLVGSASEHLRSGATQLLIWEMLQDLQAAGADGFDFIGANMKSVAASKTNWGGRIMPYYTVREYGMASLLRGVRDWYRSAKSRRSGKG